MLQHVIPADFPRYRLTVEDFHKLGEIGILTDNARVELVEGELIEMAPIGSLHASTVDTLNYRLVLAVGKTAIVRSQNPITLAKHSELQPDIAIVLPQADRYRGSHPHAEDILLLIEVADTTARYDRTVKIPLYVRHRIPEVWLVDLQQRHVEIYRNPDEGTYRQVEVLRSGLLVPSRLPEAVMEIRDLFQEIPCRELKEAGNQKVQFAIGLGNEGYPASLEAGELYCLMPDTEVTAHGYIRIIDERTEDYAISAGRFHVIELPLAVKQA